MLPHASHLLFLAGALGMVAPLATAEPPRSPGGHWPQWRGPDRTNVSTETGLLPEWPVDGPPLAWKATGLGDGVPSVAVGGGQVYALGTREGMEVLTALSETDGKKRWSVAVGPAVAGVMPVMRWLRM